MSANTGGSYDPSTAGPLRWCGRCQVSADGRRTAYLDDAEGRRAHAAALGHYPKPADDQPEQS